MSDAPQLVSLRVLQAATFAAAAHSTQVRKNVARTPYINHPLQVAYLIASTFPAVPIEVLQAAILHDTVEDTAVELDDIEREFGARVRGILDEVSDDRALGKAARKQVRGPCELSEGGEGAVDGDASMLVGADRSCSSRL